MSERKTALIVGGTKGVGLAFAQETLRRDVFPVIVAREMNAELAPVEGTQIVADVATEQGVDKLLIAAESTKFDYVFWVAGYYCRGPIVELTDGDILSALTMHQASMASFIRGFHGQRLFAKKNLPGDAAYTLVVMGSVSSYMLRKGESVYAMAKAGQAAFVRTFAEEMRRDLPGSRAILVHSGRMAEQAGVPEEDRDGVRIDPGFVAKTVWDNVAGTRACLEICVTRGNGRIEVDYVTPKPETP